MLPEGDCVRSRPEPRIASQRLSFLLADIDEKRAFINAQEFGFLTWMHWSQLTSLWYGNDAICSHDSQRETRTGGTVPHVWR
jgi:hypothetical protein